jgi:hypothetical protein
MLPKFSAAASAVASASSSQAPQLQAKRGSCKPSAAAASQVQLLHAQQL